MKVTYQWLGVLVGATLLIGTIGVVLFVDWNPTPPAPPPLVRPVKVAQVTTALLAPERRFPAVVQPGRTVDLAFQVSGPLLELTLGLGQKISAGELLARIDPLRFEQEVAALQPEVQRTRQALDRLTDLVEKNAASRKEEQDARAAYEVAAAQLKIAEQRLHDTTLLSPMDAIVVQRFVESFQNIQAAQPVARLQDITTVDIAVDLPESVVASGQRRAGTYHAVFASAPERKFPVELKEASAEADPLTLTYRVIFSMPAPQDLLILPGMTATLISEPRPLAVQERRVLVPLEALFADTDGRSSVWVVHDSAGEHRVRRTEVDILEVQNGLALTRSDGLEGRSVVLAGTSLLQENQSVRILEDRRR